MGQAPNRLGVVQRLADEHPDLFRLAHREGSPQRYDFIKLVAATLHAEDPRWGLNMKRDDDRQGLSMDVVTFRVGPTDRHVEAFDIIGGAGGDNPRAVWQDITNYATQGNPGTARWVKPEGVAPQPKPEPQPGGQQPQPQPTACGYDKDAIRVLTSAVVNLTNQLAHMKSDIAGLNERLDEEWAARVWAATAQDATVTVQVPDPPDYTADVNLGPLKGRVTLRPVKK
jgi:hypothetical protein